MVHDCLGGREGEKLVVEGSGVVERMWCSLLLGGGGMEYGMLCSADFVLTSRVESC